PNGLPVILYGEKGSGKSLMCQKMFEYGQDAGIIPEQALLQKYKVLEQEMQLAEQLLGTEGKKGLLEQCEGGILYLT
ncbi:sigma 54-interacting transcriptional regulator, partial [Desulfovibrio desulfuricans]|nr:sigma 54-interacting transcriptional regulator [Desulfovibrio desulfuricans]